jgi:hypothetical protein
MEHVQYPPEGVSSFSGDSGIACDMFSIRRKGYPLLQAIAVENAAYSVSAGRSFFLFR